MKSIGTAIESETGIVAVPPGLSPVTVTVLSISPSLSIVPLISTPLPLISA